MLFLAGGRENVDGVTQPALTADGNTAELSFRENATGGSRVHFAAWGTFGGGTITLQYQVDPGDATSWVPADMAQLTAASPAASGFVPNGNVRAVLTGATTPSLTIGLTS